MLIVVLNSPGSDATILMAIGMKLLPWYSGVAVYLVTHGQSLLYTGGEFRRLAKARQKP